MSFFSSALRRHATTTPDKVAVVDDRVRLTYSELDARVDAVATVLAERGVGFGDVVSSQLTNTAEALWLCLAVVRVGAVHNPIVASYGTHEVDFIAGEARSELLVDDRDDPLLHATGGDKPPVSAGGIGHDADADRFLVYTSGSTSSPKGARHSDRTLGAEVEAQARYHGLTADDVFVMPSPVGHVSGLLYGILLPVHLGATCVLMAEWDPGRFIALVERERGTFCGGATPFLQGLVDHPDLGRHDLSSLRVFPCGGADVPPDLIRRARSRLALRTGRGYGSTEFPSITSAAGPHHPENKRADTDGAPIGRNAVRIVDGEIQARGPELFLGYKDPSLDVDAFSPDGWFCTGDLGRLDADGYLTVTGRRKDVIIRLGEKISAREVEELLSRHESVAEVAVIALADARTGERACACVVPRGDDRELTVEELGRFLLALGVSRRKLPEQVALFDALPLSPSGKVDKRALVARLRS